MGMNMFAKLALLKQKYPIWGLTFTHILVYQATLLFILSCIALAINHFIYQYPGNVYLPKGVFLAGLNLLMIYIGFCLLQGRKGTIAQIAKEIFFLFVVILLVMLATNAVQYTPFSTIDETLLTIESLLHVDSRALIAWAHQRDALHSVLDLAYMSLAYQLCFIPVLVILTRQTKLIREYYFLLMTTTLLGMSFYYFFPTTAPASVMIGDFFSEEQKATFLKFFQIHHYIQPSTMEGGMISFPSFHVIWAWLCLYLVRQWRWVFILLLTMNFVLMVSCVLLGWHYCIDLAGSAVVIFLSHLLYDYILRWDARRQSANYIFSFGTT